VIRYELDGPATKPGWGKVFWKLPHRPWGSLSLLYIGYWIL